MKAIVRHFITSMKPGFEPESKSIFNMSNIQLVEHVISKESGIGVRNTYSEEDLFPQENLYIVVSGKVECVIDDVSYLLNKNDTILVSGYGNFAIWGKEDSVVLCVTTNQNNLSDNLSEYAILIREEEEHDVYTKNHNARVGRIAGKIYQAMFPGKDITTIVTAGSFHDIGKSRIPYEILNKPGRLTPEEYAIIQKHPLYTKEILEDVLDEFTTKIASEHHELLDGSGYPYHLKGDELCIESRILAVSDIMDALTSNRSYRNRFTCEEALKIITDMKGKLDDNVVATLLKLVEKGIITYDPDHNGIC